MPSNSMTTQELSGILTNNGYKVKQYKICKLTEHTDTQTEMLSSTWFIENLCLGIVLACIHALPISDHQRCEQGWTYGRYLKGRGCLRPLTAGYTRQECLMDGNHLTLLSRDMFRNNVFCVKDEHFDYGFDKVSTTTPIPQVPSVDLDDTKLSPEQLNHNKEGMVKAFGCCNAALE